MRFPSLFRSDDGASMVLVTMSLLLLLGASAVAVDLAAMRLDRSADQKVTDSAASAGALAALEGDGRDACEAALDYVAINSEGIGSISTSGCTSDISTTCNPAMPESHSVSTGRFDVTFWYPVDDDHELMTSAQLGAPTQTVVPDDGDPCERVGVQMSATHTSFFAQLIGFDQGTTTVHSVARAHLPGLDEPPLNLLVLDRTGCDAIEARGQGGVIVEAVTDGSDTFPGIAAADSDASSGCSPSVLHAHGQGVLRADGPVCSDELTPGTGEGCGLIHSVASGTPGCNPLACTVTPNALVAPDPTAMTDQITRAQVDYEYNCYGDYENPPPGTSWAVGPLAPGSGQDIPGCTLGKPAHIYDLLEGVGNSGNPIGLGSWQSWTGSGRSCIYETTGESASGNFVIDCPVFDVKQHVEISGNVVFDGDVNVTSSTGHLEIDNGAGSWGWVVFRDGVLTKDSHAHLTFQEKMVYMSDSSHVDMSGGGGTLTWVAPDTGDPAEFDDLALWGDSPATHFWAGQAVLTMEGVFFTPWARADYSGQSNQNQTDAQWVAHSLEAHGTAKLRITPEFEFPVKRSGAPRTTIIR